MEFEKIKEIISEQLDIDAEKITLETSFSNELKADSLDILQIISEIEELYGVEFPNEAAAEIRNVGDVVDFIKRNAK